MRVLTSKEISEFLESNSPFDYGATSDVYKVKNIFNNKGFLCLKVLKKYLLSNIDEEVNKNKDEEEEEEESNKEPEINYELVRNIFFEYEIINNLNHPNIVKVYGFFFGDKHYGPAILLEYCRKNLKKAIKSMKPIELISVIHQICSAMKYLHENKIIHRDLKMQNILVNSKGHIKICDFGIAKIIDSTTQSTTGYKGTIAFMAPELFQPRLKITEKVDVYAFGVVMFFVLSKGITPEFTAPLSYNGLEFPESINKLSRTIIEKCLSTSPETRPSFEEILQIIIDNKFKLIDGIDEEIAEYNKSH